MNPPKERQDALPSPCSRLIMKVGQAYFSARREATMPTTPWCQPSPAITTQGRARAGFSSRMPSHWR